VSPNFGEIFLEGWTG